jgi:hypothetical protein
MIAASPLDDSQSDADDAEVDRQLDDCTPSATTTRLPPFEEDDVDVSYLRKRSRRRGIIEPAALNFKESSWVGLEALEDLAREVDEGDAAGDEASEVEEDSARDDKPAAADMWKLLLDALPVGLKVSLLVPTRTRSGRLANPPI